MDLTFKNKDRIKQFQEIEELRYILLKRIRRNLLSTRYGL